MKIIILTGKFGMGHMTAALAVKQQIDNSHFNADVEVIDWLDYISPRLANKYYSFFHFLVNKGRKIYNIRYRLLENKKTDQKPDLNAIFKKCFTKLMDEKKPDIIISTLPVCSQFMSMYKEKTGSCIPLITCVTDITGHSEWINKNTDFYFVGSPSVTDKFISKGVLPDKIFETGLPVRLEFLNNDFFKSTNSKDVRHILIMGGGLGMLPKTFNFYESLELLPNTKVTIITGKNNGLYERLKDRYQNITVLGYVDNVYDYMKQADIIITKPGGITTFEAIYAEVPILALNPSLQQEIYNAQYIQKMGIGTIIHGNSKQCLEEIEKMLDYCHLDYYKSNIQKLKGQLSKYKLTKVLEMTICEGNTLANNGFKNIYQPIREDYNINEKISFNIR
ncbi:MGDG synthase family glycosyltransferase [Anaerocolumna aminovalerica]|uniref:MGDG synthase family glycosyltransferase n=1 Tax=Anaerocolumna aminovalerica TaxID=1527 RepID=UPI000BE24974|nr:glycosyltransferase [Anaerocolumna aminovalerica]